MYNIICCRLKNFKIQEKKMDKNTVKKYTKEISIILIGNIFLGIACSKWMVPNEIINGGVTSISMILNKMLSVPLLYLTNGLTLLLLIIC